MGFAVLAAIWLLLVHRVVKFDGHDVLILELDRGDDILSLETPGGRGPSSGVLPAIITIDFFSGPTSSRPPSCGIRADVWHQKLAEIL